MGAMGYRRRTGFLAGLTVAQISEFSLILGALGVSLGHLAPEYLGLITLVGLITIGLSTYLILYSHPIYERIAGPLKIFERQIPFRELREEEFTHESIEFILFGLGRFGHNLADCLREGGARVLGVDFDPQVVTAWHYEGRRVQYGDADDPELAASLPLQGVHWVVCTIPLRSTGLTLLHALRSSGYEGQVAVTAHHAEDIDVLKAAGADRVLTPFGDAARAAAESLLESRQPAHSLASH